MLLPLLTVLFSVTVGVSYSYAAIVDGDNELAAQSLTLQESIHLARENSNTLKIEDKRLRAAELNRKNVALDWVPDLLVGANYKYEENNDGHEYGELYPFITLSQVVFNDQASYAKKLESMNQLVNTKIKRFTELSQLYSYIITNYFAILQAQTRLQLEKQFLKQVQSDFDKATLQSKDGLISQLELMQNASNLELAKIEHEIGKNNLDSVEFELSFLLNLSTEINLVASDSFHLKFYTMPFAQCEEYARKHHPMLQLNNKIVQNLPEFRRLAKLTSWPSISVSAYIGTGATEWDNENKYSISITATKALYNFGKTERKQIILALELDTIEDSINNNHNSYFSDLKRLYKDFIHSGKTVQKLQASNKLAEKLNKAIQKNYSMGNISYEELLQVNKREKRRKTDYEAVKSKYLVAEMLLKLNCGVTDINTLVTQGHGWLTEVLPVNFTKEQQ